MDITELLTKDIIMLDIYAENKQEAFIKLSKKLQDNNYINNQQKYIQALLKREAEFSTSIGFGIAIPHAKDISVNKAAIAIGTFTPTIKYDGDNVKLMFMLAVPVESDNLHLEILKKLSRKIINNDFRNDILQAKTIDDIYSIMKNI